MTISARFSPHRSALLALLASCLALAASGADPVRPATAESRPAPTAAAAMPSEEECAAYGRSLAALFNQGRLDEVVRQLNIAAMAERISRGFPLSPANARNFQAGIEQQLPASLQKELSIFTQARFLRVQTVAGERRALLRLVNKSGAFNHAAFICESREPGAVSWSDAFLYSTSETISQGTRRSVLPAITQAKSVPFVKLTDEESAYVRHSKTIQQIAVLAQRGKNVEGWTLCETLPDEVKSHRAVLPHRLRIAQSLDEEKYLRVVADWETAFPADPALDLVAIDGFILQKDYPSTLRHIEALGRRIGGDPYLEFLVANVHVLAERFDEARTHARAALTAEPDLTSASDLLLTLSLKAKDYGAIVKLLEELRTTQPQVAADKLVAGAEYAAFRRSKEYLAWLDAQKAPLSETPTP